MKESHLIKSKQFKKTFYILLQGKSVRLKLEVYSSFSEEMITDSVIAKNSPSSASGGSQPSSFSFVHNAPGLDGRAGITPGEKVLYFDSLLNCTWKQNELRCQFLPEDVDSDN